VRQGDHIISGSVAVRIPPENSSAKKDISKNGGKLHVFFGDWHLYPGLKFGGQTNGVFLGQKTEEGSNAIKWGVRGRTVGEKDKHKSRKYKWIMQENLHC